MLLGPWLAAAAACGPGVEPRAEASVQAPAAGARRSEAAQAAGAPLVIEFDLPEEFWSRAVDAPDAVTGFRVGYFQGEEPDAIKTVDVQRAELLVRDRTARATIPRESAPEKAAGVVIRVQTLSRTQPSAWSAPVLFVVPVGREARAPRARSANDRGRRGGLTMADVEPHPALAEALAALLPADARLEDEVARFRQVEDLALAVVISRDQGVPFTTLARAVEGPPPQLVRNALQTLRPDIRAPNVIRQSRDEARQLLGGSGQGPPPRAARP
jgi:hypothetical protein